jgi:lysophospholipase L1-like esterase
LARNENFEIAVPVWLLADPEWVRVQHERMQRPEGVRASDVEWLRNFEEARYIEYRLKPYIDVAAVNPFNDIEVAKGVTFRLTSNGRGFRGPDVPPKRPGRLRIVTYGDSSTFGWGVDLEHTFQARLAERLAERGHDAEVLNFGMPGYNSEHGLRVQRYYATDLRPDVVIVGFGANDIRDGLQTTEEALNADETWLAGVAWGMRRLESVKALRRAIFSVYDPFTGLKGAGTGGAPRRPRVTSVPEPMFRRNLRWMAREARERGASVVFLSVCAPDPYREATILTADLERAPVVDAVERFRDLADDLKAHRLYADDVRYYEELYGPEAMEENWRYYVTTDGCHPNRAGHRIIADALAGAVLRAMTGQSAASR